MTTQTEVFIHIGMPKTGTTSIQATLFHNRDRLLAEGVLYPMAGTPADRSGGHGPHNYNYGQHNLFSLGGSINEEEIARLSDELATSRPKKIVISSENLAYAPEESVVQRMADLFVREKVTIIFYVRRQAELIESAFLERQKTWTDYRMGGKNDVKSFFDHNKLGFDFRMTITPWARVFGENSIVARVYDKRVIGDDVCQDFLRLVGITSPLAISEPQNPSLIPELSALITMIDDLHPNEHVRYAIMLEILKISSYFKGYSKHKLVDEGLEQEIRAAYSESNRTFAEKYLPRDQWAFLLDGNRVDAPVA